MGEQCDTESRSNSPIDNDVPEFSFLDFYDDDDDGAAEHALFKDTRRSSLDLSLSFSALAPPQFGEPDPAHFLLDYLPLPLPEPEADAFGDDDAPILRPRGKSLPAGATHRMLFNSSSDDDDDDVQLSGTHVFSATGRLLSEANAFAAFDMARPAEATAHEDRMAQMHAEVDAFVREETLAAALPTVIVLSDTPSPKKKQKKAPGKYGRVIDRSPLAPPVVRVTPYQCSECSAYFASNHSVRQHRYVKHRHHTVQPYPCDILGGCARVFYDPAEFRAHDCAVELLRGDAARLRTQELHKVAAASAAVAAAHANKKRLYACITVGCDYTTRMETQYRYHRVHKHHDVPGDWTEHCHVCEASFQTPRYLTRHCDGPVHRARASAPGVVEPRVVTQLVKPDAASDADDAEPESLATLKRHSATLKAIETLIGLSHPLGETRAGLKRRLDLIRCEVITGMYEEMRPVHEATVRALQRRRHSDEGTAGNASDDDDDDEPEAKRRRQV